MGIFQQLNEFNAKRQRDDAASKQAVEAKLNAKPPLESPSTSVLDVGKISTPHQTTLAAPAFDHEGYVRDLMNQPVEQSTTMGNVAFNNTAKPILETRKPKDMLESQRNNYMQQYGTWAEAEARGDISQKDWANAKIQQMIAEGKNPGEYLNVLSLMGDAETPAEKAKREKRERLGEVFNNLGNLIGNAANLYYTSKGGQYIDFNMANEKHRARMDAIKAKQDALDEQRKQILANAKIGDIKTQQAEAAAKKKAEQEAKTDGLKHKREMYKLQVQNAYKLGQIDAETASKLIVEADKATKASQLEMQKQQGRIQLKGMKSGDQVANDSKVVDSLQDGNGNVWTRNSRLTNNELSQLASYVEHPEAFMVKKEDAYGNVREEFDAMAAARNAMENNRIPEKVLSGMGLKRGVNDNKTGLGWGNGNTEDETDW